MPWDSPGIIVRSAITKRKCAKNTFSCPPQKFVRLPQLVTLVLGQNLANYFYYFVLQTYKVFLVYSTLYMKAYMRVPKFFEIHF